MEPLGLDLSAFPNTTHKRWPAQTNAGLYIAPSQPRLKTRKSDASPISISPTLQFPQSPSVPHRASGDSSLSSAAKSSSDQQDRQRRKAERRKRKERLLNKPLPETPPLESELEFDESEEYRSHNESGGSIDRSSAGGNPFLPQIICSHLYHFVLKKVDEDDEQTLGAIAQVFTDLPVPESAVSGIIQSRQCSSRLYNILSQLEGPDCTLDTIATRNEVSRKDNNKIVNLVRDVIDSYQEYEIAMSLRGSEAEAMMDTLQDVVQNAEGSTDFLARVRRLLVELSKLSTELPQFLFISGVDIVTQQNSYGGTFGDIYCSRYQGKQVALKRLRMFQTSNRGKIYRKFCAEAVLWHRLRHKFILPFLGVDAENFPRQPCMVSPWMANGTAIQFLERNPRVNIDKLLYEIAQGVAYLHAEGVVHGDIKGANILIDENWRPQLADFGLTLFAESTHHNTTDQGGTMRYMSPELIHPDHFGLKYRRTYASDIYAFGCLCIELYTRKVPFAELPVEAMIIERVLQGLRPPQPHEMTEEFWILVNRCWDQQSANRPKAVVVVNTLKEILRRSATSSSQAMPLLWESLSGVKLTPSNESDEVASSALTSRPRQRRGSKSRPPLSESGLLQRTKSTPISRNVLRAATEASDEEDDDDWQRSYCLRPIRAHADPSRAYDELRVLSRSPTLEIVIAHLKDTKSVVEIRKVEIASQPITTLHDLVKEFVAMRYLHHPNIVNYIDAFRHEDRLWVVMDFSPAVLSLRKVIAANTERNQKEKESFVRSVTKGILKGLVYLHRKGVVHRDVIAENVLIGKSTVMLKLCAMISEPDFHVRRSLAPEVRSSQLVTAKSDIWGLAVMGIDMLDGQRTLDLSQPNLLESLSKGYLDPSPLFMNYLARCMQDDPDDRPSAIELLETDPFLL